MPLKSIRSVDENIAAEFTKRHPDWPERVLAARWPHNIIRDEYERRIVEVAGWVAENGGTIVATLAGPMLETLDGPDRVVRKRINNGDVLVCNLDDGSFRVCSWDTFKTIYHTEHTRRRD